MGKQQHDLGVRKRKINALQPRPFRPEKAPTNGSIGDPRPVPANYYGPPEDVRMKAYDLRQAGYPVSAQRVMDGLPVVGETDDEPSRSGGKTNQEKNATRSAEARERRRRLKNKGVTP